MFFIFSSVLSKILTFNLDAINAACSSSLGIVRDFSFNGAKQDFAIMNETLISNKQLYHKLN